MVGQKIRDEVDVDSKTAHELNWIFRVGLSYLTKGRVFLYLSQLGVDTNPRELLDLAVRTFRDASRQDYLPSALLSRAWLRALQRQPDLARADLDEAQQIAERGSMRLHLADIHLHRARLFRDKEELKRARALIEQCGYWRRKEELEDAEEAAKGWSVQPHRLPRLVSGVAVVLTSKHLEVLRFTYERVEFDTRLREADDQVAEYWPTFGSIQYPVGEKEFFRLLSNLDMCGYVVKRARVHPNDSSEYLITWNVTSEGKKFLADAG